TGAGAGGAGAGTGATGPGGTGAEPPGPTGIRIGGVAAAAEPAAAARVSRVASTRASFRTARFYRPAMTRFAGISALAGVPLGHCRGKLPRGRRRRYAKIGRARRGEFPHETALATTTPTEPTTSAGRRRAGRRGPVAGARGRGRGDRAVHLP